MFDQFGDFCIKFGPRWDESTRRPLGRRKKQTGNGTTSTTRDLFEISFNKKYVAGLNPELILFKQTCSGSEVARDVVDVSCYTCSNNGPLIIPLQKLITLFVCIYIYIYEQQ